MSDTQSETSTHRIALGIEYCGRDYFGWQSQQQGPSIQSELEAAVSFVADEAVRVVCAGRTDRGVHASAQVVHFDTRAERGERNWVLGINSALPRDIGVTWARAVSAEFHARFSAVQRSYHYLILNRATRPALWQGLVSWECQPLDAEKMDYAARQLLGEHDFSSFRAAGCQAKHPVRTINQIKFSRRQQLLTLEITANAFLQHMVRNIVGSLLLIGRGEKPVEWLKQVLLARQRQMAGASAAPDGLYLCGVSYPAEFDLPGGVEEIPSLAVFDGTAFRN